MPRNSDQHPTGAMSRSQGKKAAARQRIDERRAAEQAAATAAARKRAIVISAIVAAVVVVAVVVIVVVVQSTRTSTAETGAAPANATDGAFTVGQPDAPVTVQVYEDFLCPACRQFEAASGDVLRQLVDDGTAQVSYQPVAFLNRFSPDDYSTRSMNAVAVVADEAGVDAFRTMHEELFVQQPEENGPGLTDDQLIAIAADAGATGDSVAAGIRDLRFEGWTERVTEQASKNDVTSTPTVLVDGEPLADRSPAGLTAAVQAAAEEG